MEILQAVSIQNDYEARQGDSNWSTRVEFDIEEGSVRIFEFHGNGQTMRCYHGVDRLLAVRNSADFANVDEIVSTLESEEAQALMATVRAGFERAWDGSNHVGRLTEEASEALETLQEKVEACWESLPTFWEASEYFSPAGFTGEKLLETIEDHGGIEEAVDAEVLGALPEAHLQARDVEQFFRQELKQLAETDEPEEIEVANRARKLLDLKPL